MAKPVTKSGPTINDKNLFGVGDPNGLVWANEGIEYIDLKERKRWKQGRMPFGNQWSVQDSDVTADTDFLPEGDDNLYDQDDPSTGGGIVDITYSALSALITASTAQKGVLYHITDRSLFIRALDDNLLASSGWYLATNPDWEAVGDYSASTFGTYIGGWKASVPVANGEVALDGTDDKYYRNITGTNTATAPSADGTNWRVVQRGLWLSSLTVAVGDVVIWNNLHWVNLTGAVGTAPDGDATNWDQVETTSASYINEIDVIRYSFADDLIISRTDKRNNHVSGSVVYVDNNDPLAYFQWGRDACINNRVDNSLVTNRNAEAGLTGTTIKNSTITITGTAQADDSVITDSAVTISGASTIDNSQIYNSVVTVSGGSNMSDMVAVRATIDNTTSGTTRRSSFYISTLTISGTATCDLAILKNSTLTLSSACTASGCNLINSIVTASASTMDNAMLVNTTITISGTTSIEDSYIEGYAGATLASYGGGEDKKYCIGLSTFSETLNLNGLSTITVAAITGVVNVSASDTNIDNISGMSGNHNISVRPQTGVTVTFRDASVSGGNIHLEVTPLTLNGTNGAMADFFHRSSTFITKTLAVTPI